MVGRTFGRAWPVGYGGQRRADGADDAAWPIGYSRHLPLTGAFVLVLIPQPGLLDTAGVCVPVLCAHADYSAWPLGYSRHLLTCALCLC